MKAKVADAAMHDVVDNLVKSLAKPNLQPGLQPYNEVLPVQEPVAPLVVADRGVAGGNLGGARDGWDPGVGMAEEAPVEEWSKIG